MAEEKTEATAPKELREALERTQAENAALKDTLRSTAYMTAGLDPTKGIGKAVATVYDGFDPSEIKRVATEEFEWTPPTQSSGPSDTERQIAAATARTEQVMVSSQSIQPADAAQAIRDAEQAGDWTTALALKMQQLKQT